MFQNRFLFAVPAVSWAYLPILDDVYRVGFPSMIMQITESVVFALFNYVLCEFGSLALTAVGIAIRVADLAWRSMYDASQGLLPVVGFSFGARLWKRLWRAAGLASVGLALLSVLTLATLEIFAPQLIAISSDDANRWVLPSPLCVFFCQGWLLLACRCRLSPVFKVCPRVWKPRSFH